MTGKTREDILAMIAAQRVAVPPALRQALHDLKQHMAAAPQLAPPGPGQVEELTALAATLLQEVQMQQALTGRISRAPLVALLRTVYLLGASYGVWPGNWDFNDPEAGLPAELKKEKP